MSSILEKFKKYYVYQIVTIAVIFISGTWVVSEKLRVDPINKDNQYYKERLELKEKDLEKASKKNEKLEKKIIQLEEITKTIIDEMESIQNNKPDEKNRSAHKAVKANLNLSGLIAEGKLLLKRASGEIPNNPVTKIELDKWRGECSNRLAKINNTLAKNFMEATKNQASDLERDSIILNGLIILNSLH